MESFLGGSQELSMVSLEFLRHGKPAGVLIGFASEDDWFDYRLENDAKFLTRITAARKSLREGKGVRIEDLTE